MFGFVTALALMLGATEQALAQTPCSDNCTAKKSETFSVAADHNGVDTDGYKLYQNNVVVRDVVSPIPNGGVISFSFPVGIAVSGTYVFQIEAYNIDGEATKSDPITLTVQKGKPAKPTSIRISKP